MALFTEAQLRNRVTNEMRKGGTSSSTPLEKAETILLESQRQQRLFSSSTHYDIFLSHSSKDVILVTGLTLKLEDMGYTVYVDWIEDPELDRAHVTKHTAEKLKRRMKQSSSLIYAFSEHSEDSRWMPWELGYFDGIKKTVSVLPISKTESRGYKGTEYLGLYYYSDFDPATDGVEHLWVCDSPNIYISYKSWLKGNLPFKRN